MTSTSALYPNTNFLKFQTNDFCAVAYKLGAICEDPEKRRSFDESKCESFIHSAEVLNLVSMASSQKSVFSRTSLLVLNIPIAMKIVAVEDVSPAIVVK